MNHDGSFGNAIRLIEEATKSGVDAVKFQMHISEAETLADAPTPPYFTIEKRYEYFNRTSFTYLEWEKLRDFTHSLGLDFIVSPFSQKAAEILTKLKIDGFKIASGETTNLPLLEYIDKQQIPVLLSTGMSNWDEIDQAVNALKNNLCMIFQCSSEYPCQPESVGINVIQEMKKRYPGIPIGFSDHTLSSSSAIAALYSGATIFEKHFTLSKKMYGADARFSFEPHEMKSFIDEIRFIEKVLINPVDKNNLEKYKQMKLVFEKSIVASKNLPKGKILEISDLDFKKPGNGIRADKYHEIIGKKLKCDINHNEQILYSFLE
ncbi:MAG: N-acetylneuraminate synthase family protein [Candidatus Lokiarchaeota archaeon]|nr:N-acetylneuraminate synthase family protein [Candidatus Harpocratesius repetitus]